MNICSSCSRSLPLEQFPVDRSRRAGRMGRCRECDNARSRRYYAANSDKVIARIQARQQRSRRLCAECGAPATSQRHWFCDTCRADGARRNKSRRTPVPRFAPSPDIGCAPSCRVDASPDETEAWITAYRRWGERIRSSQFA